MSATEDFKVERIGEREFLLTLGEESVTVRSDDPDIAIARGVEILQGNTGYNIVATKPGDIVINVPDFKAESKAPTAKVTAKAKKD